MEVESLASRRFRLPRYRVHLSNRVTDQEFSAAVEAADPGEVYDRPRVCNRPHEAWCTHLYWRCEGGIVAHETLVLYRGTECPEPHPNSRLGQELRR